jgi:hypothetical protein
VAQFIEIAAQVICQHKGILDKFLGDEVMALFSSHSKNHNYTHDDIVHIFTYFVQITIKTKYSQILDKRRRKDT